MRSLGFRLSVGVRRDEQGEVASLLGAYLRDREVEVDEDRIDFDRGMANLTIRTRDDLPDPDGYRNRLQADCDAFITRWKAVRGRRVLQAFLEEERAIQAFYAAREDLRAIAADLATTQREATLEVSHEAHPSAAARASAVLARGAAHVGRGIEVLSAFLSVMDRVAGR